MDTSTLRWILIGIGAAVIAVTWLFWDIDKRRKASASRSRKAPRKPEARREPTLDAAAVPEPPDGEHGEQTQGELNIGSPVEPVQGPVAPEGPAPDKIVSLFLLARDNHVITGAELLRAVHQTGMEFGEMNIFHRHADGTGQPVFSMANAAKPGYFARDEWNMFETNGVALFMTLPGPMDALDGWDAMLATARRLAELLNAEVLDEQHKPFTRLSEARIREEMREHDRQRPRDD